MTDIYSREKRANIMSRVRATDTKPERIVRRLLHREGYRFRLHRKDLPGKPDIILPRHNTAIFVHGCFWHGHDCRRGQPPASNTSFWLPKLARNIQRDQENQQALAENGWKVIVVWQCQTLDPDALLKTITKTLCQ